MRTIGKGILLILVFGIALFFAFVAGASAEVLARWAASTPHEAAWLNGAVVAILLTAIFYRTLYGNRE